MISPIVSQTLAAAAAAVLVAGCAGPVPGSATLDPAENPRGATPALLDPGHYPTTPRPPLGNAGTKQVGQQIEAHRMAEVTAIPFEIDPKFATPKNPAVALIDPTRFDLPFSVSGGVGTAMAKHDFLAGFLTSGGADRLSAKYLINAVLRFATAEDAAAAAADMAAATISAGTGPGGTPRRPISLPKHPDTAAVITNPEGMQTWTTLHAYTAEGPFVIAQQINNTDSTAEALELLGNAIDVQRGMLAEFTPTPVDQLADLPIDPDGLLARTLPAGAMTNDPEQGLYGSHGAAALMSQPQRSQKLFADTGMDSLSKALVNVYQAADAKGAEAIVDDFFAEAVDSKFTPSSAVAGLPGARCALSPPPVLATNKRHFYCLAAAERYTIEVNAVEERDAHQQLAAQYLMLTAS